VARSLPFKTIRWIGGIDGHIELLDQTLLPNEVCYLAVRDVETLWEAIRSLRVRGAPAIGCAAAMGVVLGIQRATNAKQLFENLKATCEHLAEARPTAVNLFWALERMERRARAVADQGADVEGVKQALVEEACLIRDEDAAMCRAIGRAGQGLIPDGAGVLTHCNAGALATSEYGTALGLMYAAQERGKRFKVYADETRPLLQGARLTAWELMQAGIDVTLICDSMAAQVMKEGKISIVVTGADRVAANGDVANKIGTYSVAVLARSHNIPFYVACPTSTFDLDLTCGSEIPIEERPFVEITQGFGRKVAPEGVKCYCPAFDVTPAGLISAIITEKGVIQPVSREKILKFFQLSP